LTDCIPADVYQRAANGLNRILEPRKDFGNAPIELDRTFWFLNEKICRLTSIAALTSLKGSSIPYLRDHYRIFEIYNIRSVWRNPTRANPSATPGLFEP